MKNELTGLEIAIIGIGCRFPGANNWRQYWANLSEGIESVKFYTHKELVDHNVPAERIASKEFVNADVILEDKEFFDSSFFGYRPEEARLMNPEHRIFHECIWEALEDAGCDPQKIKGLIGLFAGAGDDLPWKIYSTSLNKNKHVDDFTLNYLNSKEYLASLISYKLDLQGPSCFINTACSSSAVAVHSACKSLLFGESKIAIAGGVNLKIDSQLGYMTHQNSILSKDGHCRAFDKDASGTISGEGAGAVVMKRLADAIEDGDHIYAVIKGSAINNDGIRKVGFTAPSIEGQADCVRMAHLFSRVDPYSLSYIECHGTGTRLGDPIEVKALNKVYGNLKNYDCAIGSVKTNIGHLDAASGVAGLIKTALCLKHKKIPATLNYKEANPEIDFDNSPFYVNTAYMDMPRIGQLPLRAGVSSFGIGGTNAHIVLEEFNAAVTAPKRSQTMILPLSAKKNESLFRYMDKLRAFLILNPSVDLEDLCYTMQAGRRHFLNRLCYTFKDRQQLIEKLTVKSPANENFNSGYSKNNTLIFSGLMDLAVGFGKCFYEGNKLFYGQMNEGFETIKALTGKNYKDILYPDSHAETKSNDLKSFFSLRFLLEYSLAKLLFSWGIKPSYMIGNETGELVVASLSGVIEFKDVLRLLIKKEELLITQQDFSKPECLKIEESFFSDYLEEVKKIQFNKPQIPFISYDTGKLIEVEEALSFKYWFNQLSGNTDILKGLKNLSGIDHKMTFICTGLADIPAFKYYDILYLNLDSCGSLYDNIASIWSSGSDLDWDAFNNGKRNKKISLPTYAFEKNKYVSDCDVDNLYRIFSNGNTDESFLFQVSNTSYLTPEDEVTHQLTELWKSFFGLESIDVNDDFYDLGGDSLMATMLCKRIFEATNIEVSLTHFFADSTINGLSKIIKSSIIPQGEKKGTIII